MRFLVRRVIRIDRETGQKEYQDKEIIADKLTVGCDSDQHLIVPTNTVELNHAEIKMHRKGKLSIKSLTPSSIHVNGQPCRTSKLEEGDRITIGSATITVEFPQPDYSAVFSLEYDHNDDNEKLESLHIVSLEQAGLRKSPWSWFLGISILLLFLLIPLAGLLFPSIEKTLRESPLLPDDNIWLSGPLHNAHQFIGNDCNACHAEPFAIVKNAECEACHAEIQHHIDVNSEDIKIFAVERCAECHREHNEPGNLVDQNPGLCTDCHQILDTLKMETELANVTDFGTDHPEFRFSMLQVRNQTEEIQWESFRVKRNAKTPPTESSNLVFPHKNHLDPEGLETPDGDKVMVCADCHQPDSSGRIMKPIIMEEHCSHCHSLLFDENDLDSKIPHGNLQLFFEVLTEHFSRVFLEQRGQNLFPRGGTRAARRPGREAKQISRSEQQRALDWAQQQSLMIGGELIEDRLCIDCHEVTKIPGKTGFDQWKVKPVALTQHWLPLATFDHASHINEECIDCHHDVEKSEESQDVLLPKIDDCRECHGGVDEKDKLASSCLMCHKFHLPERGLFNAGSVPEKKRKPGEMKSSTGNKGERHRPNTPSKL